jgi:myxalamid-type polyketide synthase MxaE and MxaD
VTSRITTSLTRNRLRDWMVGRVAEMLKAPPGTVSSHAVFSDLGLSSMQAVELTGELEELTGREISATLVYEHPTIDDAAAYIVGL